MCPIQFCTLILIEWGSFRGPAPLQHILLNGQKTTGITLQSLDEKSFDHGIILAQTEQPGLPIPSPRQCTYSELLEFVTPKAAEMLVQGIKDRVFVPPLVDVGWYKPDDMKHAPKITPEDRRIDWIHWSSEMIDRRNRALGRLWSNIWVSNQKSKRFIFEDFEVVPRPEVMDAYLKSFCGVEQEQNFSQLVHFIVYSAREGQRRPQAYVDDGDTVIIATRCGKAVRVKEITVEGQSKGPASKVMQSIREEDDWRVLKKHGMRLPAVEQAREVRLDQPATTFCPRNKIPI